MSRPRSSITLTLEMSVSGIYASHVVQEIEGRLAGMGKLIAGDTVVERMKVDVKQISLPDGEPEADSDAQVGKSRDGEAEGDGTGASSGEDSVGETGRGDTEGPLPAPSERVLKKSTKVKKPRRRR
jgi:hypothetical protein